MKVMPTELGALLRLDGSLSLKRVEETLLAVRVRRVARVVDVYLLDFWSTSSQF